VTSLAVIRVCRPRDAAHTEPVVSLTHNSLLRLTLEQACRAAGFAPNVVAETSDLDFLVQLAAEQVGVAILPASGVLHAEGLAVIPLTGPSIERRLVFVWPEDYLSPAALAFTDLIRREYKSSAS
jgi:DNA-binding transcriptional LysR family regulator